MYAERSSQATVASSSEPSASKNASNNASPSSHASTEAQWSPGQEPWSIAGVSDMELARYYFAHTVDTFAATSTRPHQSDMWRAVVPALAYNSLAVRRGMLTLAAMDLYFHSAEDTKAAAKWLEVAEHHGEIFVRESRRQLRELQPSEIDSSVACSRLLAILGLAFYHVHRANGTMLTDGASWTWLQLMRGVKPVNIAISEASRPIDPAFTIDLVPEVAFEGSQAPPTGYMFMECSHPLLELVQRSWPERLAALQQVLMLGETSQRLSRDDSRDLNIAVDILDKVSRHLFSGQMHSLFRTVMTWPAIIPKGFLDMLIRCSPVALAIYAHWLVLVILLDKCWWMDDMGREVIREVCDLLTDDESEIQLLLQWPRDIAGVDIAIISPQDVSMDPVLMR